MMDLRPYQAELIERVRLSYKEGRFKRVCLQLPTGAGKTVIAGEIVRRVHRRNRRGMMLVHRRELIAQAVDTLRLFGHDPGVIAAGETPEPGAWFQVASVQTLNRRLGKVAPLSPGDLLIVDEAHHVAARTWEKTIGGMGDCHVLGLTATPERADGAGLDHIFEDLIVGPSVGELADVGALAVPSVLAPEGAIDVSRMRRRYGDYDRGDMERAGLAVIPCVHESWDRYAKGKRTIVFAVSRNVGRRIRDDFASHGVLCEYVDGETRCAEREAIIGRFKSGATTVVVNVEIISEGFDCPECECVIQARPTMSLALHLQQIGRAMRPGDGKVVLDLARNHERHGLPDDERAWALDAAKRKAGRKKERPRAVRCEQCSAVMRPGADRCPACGAEREKREREVTEVSGVGLKEVRKGRPPNWGQALRARKKGIYQDVLRTPIPGLWRTVMTKRLETLAAELGYHPYWVKHQMDWWGPQLDRAARKKLDKSGKSRHNNPTIGALEEIA